MKLTKEIEKKITNVTNFDISDKWVSNQIEWTNSTIDELIRAFLSYDLSKYKRTTSCIIKNNAQMFDDEEECENKPEFLDDLPNKTGDYVKGR